jgi:23S rRNA (adenine2503-C2)-methyltransferase
MVKQDIKDLSLEDLTHFLKHKGYPSFYAQQIFGWIYKKGIEDFNSMTDISKEARLNLCKNFYFSKLSLIKRETSQDRTEKFLFKLSDGSKIETVLIPEGKRLTLCISTQVGCKFRCKFCVSGLGGFRRNLTVSEIVNQYLELIPIIKPRKITNIVFMGIGEPLDNFDNVVKSIRILREPQGVYFGKRRICVSTVGIPSMIRKLADLNLGIKLSVSLHSADQATRAKLVPAQKKFPLTGLIKAIRVFSRKEKFPVTLEYVMIRGVNISREDALKLARLAKSINCKVNLIPYNPSSYFKWASPLQREIEEFKGILKRYHILFTLRRSRGQDIQASCGLLRGRFS